MEKKKKELFEEEFYSDPFMGVQQLERFVVCCLEISIVSSTSGRSSLASSLAQAATASPNAVSTFVAFFADVSTSGRLPFSAHQASASSVDICFSNSGTSTWIIKRLKIYLQLFSLLVLDKIFEGKLREFLILYFQR